jgi:hypothetical protein
MNYFLDVIPPQQQPQNPFPLNASLPDVIDEGGGKKEQNKSGSTVNQPVKQDVKKSAGQLAADLVLKNVAEKKPYTLSKKAVDTGNDPSNTCIGSLCNVYKDLGIDFSGLGSEKAGVRESNTGGAVVEYNPTFTKNYKKAGFEMLGGKTATAENLYQMIVGKKLQPGDILQYMDENGKPVHSNMIVGMNEDGSYKMYNGYAHTKGDNPVYNTNAEEFEKNPEAFKNLKFNVFRIGEDGAKKILNKVNTKPKK